MKVSVEQLEKSIERFDYSEKLKKPIVKYTPKQKLFVQPKSISKKLTFNNITGDKENLKQRKEMLKTSGVEPVDFAFERAIGKNDSVYTNFISLITEAKRKICRIIIKDDASKVGFATGFMVSKNLMLTNWHVFKNKEEAATSCIQFNYELGLDGHPQKSISFELSPSTFFYSFKDLDYCLVAVEETDISGEHKLEEIGYIYLDPNSGKLGNENQELLNIIHHPNGDYKQLSIRENRFKKIMPTTLWYESDTAQGSSGSPVFNDQWQVVALHHMGVASKNDQGEYLDKEGDVIPVIDNKIDIARIHWEANEGIRISVILKHIRSEHPGSSHVAGLATPPPTPKPRPIVIPQPIPEPIQKEKPMENSVNISIPNSLIESQKTVQVNISVSDRATGQGAKNSPIDPRPVNDLEQESLRLERSMDYSECVGYRSDFIGDDFRVAIPKPLKSVRNYVAKINNSRAYILRYHKYSVIFNDFKRMPFISAVNIDGDEDKRQDKTERRDKWIRDTRIDLNCQLNNDFYYKSGFDKGHMSRREDANWGKTPEEAKTNADLTCVHTNACPQVPKLNRSTSRGLWGKLEKVILEKGAIKEEGKTGKISVFNGPIFRDSDPIYNGVKIPMEYFKVVIWLNDKKKLRATAFTLSQADFVEEIDFEDIGIDQNILYKEYQISLTELQELTQLDFSKIIEFDTFKGKDSQVEIANEKQLSKIIA